MIRIDLQKFGGRGSSGGGGGGGGRGSTSTNAPGSGHGGGGRSMDGGSAKPSAERKETQEEIVRRITDSRGNVKEIVDGQRYNIYKHDSINNKEMDYGLSYSADDAREALEDYHYDEKTGMFTNGRWKLRVALAKKRKR